MTYFVEVVNMAGEVVKRIECGDNERKAERVEVGVLINLNHDGYFTRIVEESQ